jgi:hypothetical protein
VVFRRQHPAGLIRQPFSQFAGFGVADRGQVEPRLATQKTPESGLPCVM